MDQDKDFHTFLEKIDKRIFFLGSSNVVMKNAKIAELDARVNIEVSKQREKLFNHIFKQTSFFHIKSMAQYIKTISSIKTLVGYFQEKVSGITQNLKDAVDVLKKFFFREEKLIEQARKTSTNAIKYIKEVSKFYEVDKLLNDNIAQKSIENMAIIQEFSNGNIEVISNSNGYDNKKFRVEFKAKSGKINDKFYLEKGTIWVPKDEKNYGYQPLVQKNRIIIDQDNNNYELMMFCGDQSKKSPQNIGYIPTDIIIKDPVSQDDIWKKTVKYRSVETKTDL